MSWRRAACCLASLLGVSGGEGRGVDWDKCNRRFEAPEPGSTALALNGVRLPDTCFDSDEERHQIFIIGDWGGLPGDPETGPVTADHRKDGFHKRNFVAGLDDVAQHRVRDSIRDRAAYARPEYILNVGDNFYWGGVEADCGTTRKNMSNFSSQWEDIFENFYTGDGLDGVQWLGVLGNHDYGGYLYSNAWDQAIMYTWKELAEGRTMRWVTPAQYWRSTVHYKTFSVDYLFLDTNVYDAFDPYKDMANNICSYAYNYLDNGLDCSCEGGPPSIDGCTEWFRELWEEQQEWLHLHLSTSKADWQIVVTHFPPTFEPELFGNLSLDYGIDLFITGHLHRQEVHGADDEDNFLAPTAWVVSGGGGGITSDFEPNLGGDTQYGFMHMTLSNDSIEVVNVQHTGVEGFRVVVPQRPCVRCSPDDVAHNLQVYQEGVQRRGWSGAPKFSSSTVTSTITSTMTSTTTNTRTSVTTSSTTITTTTTITTGSFSVTADNLAAREVQRGVVWINDRVAEIEESGGNVSGRTATWIRDKVVRDRTANWINGKVSEIEKSEVATRGTAFVSMAGETAQWVGREMTAGEKKAVNATGGPRELLRASGAVGLLRPYGAAIVGASAVLVVALVLCLRGRSAEGAAYSAGVAHHDHDAGRQLIREEVPQDQSIEGVTHPDRDAVHQHTREEVSTEGEQRRRRWGGPRSPLPREAPGDAASPAEEEDARVWHAPRGAHASRLQQDEAELWTYTPTNGLKINTREVPAIDGKKTEKTLRPGDTFRVIDEMQVGEVTFLRLAGGEGWLFDNKPGLGRMCTKAESLEGSTLRTSYQT